MRLPNVLTHLVAPLLVVMVVLAASLGCVGTPLPDPPSARAEAMTLTDVPPNAVRLAGAAGAIDPGSDRPGAATLRVTNARLDVRAEVPVDDAGAFTADLSGAITDTLHLELVLPEGDVFLAAVASSGGVVVEVDAGPDRDGDLSPDAVDCAPDDGALIARECPMSCVSDIDCAAGEICTAGVCMAPVTEICGNLIDDDRDGEIDEMDCI